MVWKIKNFPGGREFLMRCRFALPSVPAEEETAGRMPPIKVNFELPYFTVSGIQVRLLAMPCLMQTACHAGACASHAPLGHAYGCKLLAAAIECCVHQSASQAVQQARS